MGRKSLLLEMDQMLAERCSLCCFYLHQKPGFMIPRYNEIYLPFILIPQKIEPIFTESVVGPPMDSLE